MLMILGGGLAGLSAAYHSDGIVFERDRRAGGHAKSQIRDGFVFDEGIHVLHTKNDYVLDLLARLGVRMVERRREAWIHSFGVHTRYPFQANTFGLPVPIVKDCLVGFIDNEFKDREQIKTYEDWIHFMFGKGIAQHFMIPYSIKFWGVPPSELTTEWVNIRHPRPTLEEVIEGALHDQTKGFGVNAEFRYPEAGGFGAIGEALAASTPDRLRLGKTVTRIDPGRHEVEFNRSERLRYERAICTLPLPEVVDLIDGAPMEVQDAASRLRCNSILVVNLGVRRPQITEKHWIYYLEPDFIFFRISFPFNKAANMAPPGMSSISAEIAYSPAHPLPVSRERVVQRVIEDLQVADVLAPGDEVVHAETIDIPYGYVIFDAHRKSATRVIHEYLRRHEIFPCGRYGSWAYLWSDEAILSGRKVALQVQGRSEEA